MPIRNFRVGPERGLQLAAADGLPNLMVIAGPNGAGKTSLLTALHRAGGQNHQPAEEQIEKDPGTNVILIAVHRGWDSTYVQREALWGNNDARPILAVMPDQGHMGSGQAYGTLLKNRLVRLFVEQRKVQDEYLNRAGPEDFVRRADIPDLFEPLKELVRSVLPHLRFEGVVDEPDQGLVRCLFSAPGAGGLEFDLDYLSSGEKAAIGLLFPLVEEQVVQLTAGQPTAAPSLLIDEVEQHLHPGLQLQVLQYLRRKAADGTAQFILTTHSPTLLDELNDEELYLLSPATLRPGENQLSRLTTNQERLEVVRDLTGSTHLITRAKPIVFVEGEPERSGVASDAHLISQLLPQARAWGLVPGRSKKDVTTAVRQLRHQHLQLPGTPVFGLVDADRDATTGDDHIIAWPVAMIENLLLDADAIYRALTPFGTKTGAISLAAVTDALETAARGRYDEEVRLRVESQLTIGYLKADVSRLSDLDVSAQEQVDDWLRKLNALDPGGLHGRAVEQVNAILARGEHLERFHGKRILKATYKALKVQAAGVGQTAFSELIASAAAGSERIARLAEPAIRRIALYFPDGLTDALRSGGDADLSEQLAIDCERHRRAWASSGPDLVGPIPEGREDLRRRIFEFARTTRDPQRITLTRLASEIGTL